MSCVILLLAQTRMQASLLFLLTADFLQIDSHPPPSFLCTLRYCITQLALSTLFFPTKYSSRPSSLSVSGSAVCIEAIGCFLHLSTGRRAIQFASIPLVFFNYQLAYSTFTLVQSFVSICSSARPREFFCSIVSGAETGPLPAVVVLLAMKA